MSSVDDSEQELASPDYAGLVESVLELVGRGETVDEKAMGVIVRAWALQNLGAIITDVLLRVRS